MIKIALVLVMFLYACSIAQAEFDCEVGDVYYLDDGTPGIVVSVSKDRMQIVTDTKLYRERETKWRTLEAKQKQFKRDKVMEGILEELRNNAGE